MNSEEILFLFIGNRCLGHTTWLITTEQSWLTIKGNQISLLSCLKWGSPTSGFFFALFLQITEIKYSKGVRYSTWLQPVLTLTTAIIFKCVYVFQVPTKQAIYSSILHQCNGWRILLVYGVAGLVSATIPKKVAQWANISAFKDSMGCNDSGCFSLCLKTV